jgi:hypothetical protein
MKHFQEYSNCCAAPAQYIDKTWFCPDCSNSCDTKLYFVEEGSEYEFWEAHKLELLDYSGAAYEEVEEMEEE